MATPDSPGFETCLWEAPANGSQALLLGLRDRVYGWSLPVFTTVLLAGADCWLGFQFGEAAGAWGGAGAGVVISVVLRLFVSRATAGGGGGLHRLSSRWWHGRR